MARWDDALPLWQRAHRLASALQPGVPAAVRPMIWQRAVGNAQGVTPDTFRALRAELQAEYGAEQEVVEQMVRVDVGRTVSGVPPEYSRRGSVANVRLRLLLLLFSKRIEGFSYCQGLSFVAATLLAQYCGGAEGAAEGPVEAAAEAGPAGGTPRATGGHATGGGWGGAPRA